MKFSIHEITPASWGDNYRFVDSFDIEEDAKLVLEVLERVNINFKLYTIVDWSEPKVSGKLFSQT